MVTLPLPTRRETALAVALIVSFAFLWNVDLAYDEQHALGVKLVPSDHGWPFLASQNHSAGPAVKLPTVDEALVKWSSSLDIPQTKYLAGSTGWSMLDSVIVMNGTIFIITDKPESFPEVRMLISSGIKIMRGEDEILRQEPTSKDMQIISSARALELIGTSASRVEGVTWLCNDAPQYLSHYYHFIAEITLGFWRTYSTLDPNISSSGLTTLPAPRRLVLPHTLSTEWRDYSRLSTYITSAVFPSLAFEFAETWTDRAEMARPFIYDRLLIADRAAAMRSPHWPVAYRMITPVFEIPSGSEYWWAPVRRNLLSFLRHHDSMLELESELDGGGAAQAGVIPVKPVITYVSRQGWGRRMLREADHQVLVRALERLRDTYGYELNIVSMDTMSREDQLILAARTTIMLGVHGNGLTHALWMNPSPRTALLEFFFPEGFTHDYEYPTRVLGIAYYCWWGDRYFDRGKLPIPNEPEGFQGNEIPLDGERVARLVHELITGVHDDRPVLPPRPRLSSEE